MVLGPSVWLDGDRVASSVPDEPLETRRRIARALRARDLDAFLMEDEEQEEGEPNTALFRRLVKEKDVQRFLVYWPLGARLHGLEVEAGALLQWLENGILEPAQVYLLVERGVVDEGEVSALSEPGNRTRYHEDFEGYEVRIRVWDDAYSLSQHVFWFAEEAKASGSTTWHEAV